MIREDEKPVVSVIVPVFNIEEYVCQCVDSICNQSYELLEIILVDDGSTDSSGELCDQYAEQDSRVKVIHKTNGGLVSARKAGTDVATGIYSIHIDGDDWIESDAVEILVNRMILSETDFVQFGWYRGRTSMCIYDSSIEELTEKRRNEIIQCWMNGKAILDSQIFNKIYKTVDFRESYLHVDNDYSYGEDQVFFLHFLKRVHRAELIGKVLYHYREREGSLSHDRNRLRQFMRNEKLNDTLFKIISSEYKRIPVKDKELFFLRKNYENARCGLKNYGVFVPYYQFPQMELLRNKKVVIYGAGSVGHDFLMQMSLYDDVSVIAWVDNNSSRYHYEYREVMPVKKLRELDYDYVIVAILDIRVAREVMNELVDVYHVAVEKVTWNYDRETII